MAAFNSVNFIYFNFLTETAKQEVVIHVQNLCRFEHEQTSAKTVSLHRVNYCEKSV